MRLHALLICAALSLLLPAWAHALTPGQRVLVVHSYSPDNAWTGKIAAGIREGLKGSGASIESFYMDAKRRPAPEQLRQAALQAMERIAALTPQVVIAVDDAAQEYLVVPHLRGQAGPQVIACGVNAPFAKYGYPAANVSGVRGRWHYRDGFSLLKQILPKVQSVAFLVEDTETGGYAVADLRDDARQNGPFALRLAGVERVRTFQQWQALIRRYQTRVDALALPLYHGLKDERTGQVVPPEEVMAWTNSVNKLPTLGFVDYAKDHGLLCGVLASGEEQGYLAGRMAAAVLSTGQQAGTMPVQVNKRGVVMVNLKTAHRLGVAVPYPIIEAAGVLVK